MVKLEDIASVLNISKATVSKALRGSNDISSETKEKVLQVAKQLGYTRSYDKKKLINEKSRTVCIICPEIIGHYYPLMVAALSRQLREEGYYAAIFTTDFSESLEEAVLTHVAKMDIAGVAFLTEHTDITKTARKALGQMDIPLVIFGLNYEAGKYDVISVDEKLGINAAIDCLIAAGRSNIAFVGDRYGAKKLRFLKEALEARGLSLCQEYLDSSGERFEECGYSGMKALLKKAHSLDAVFGAYDEIAFGAYRAICEAGKTVPDDIALIGFDNVPLCRFLPVTMSTIDSHNDEMCEIAVSILLKKITDPSFRVVQRVSITPDFIPRESISKKTRKE